MQITMWRDREFNYLYNIGALVELFNLPSQTRNFGIQGIMFEDFGFNIMEVVGTGVV